MDSFFADYAEKVCDIDFLKNVYKKVLNNDYYY